MIDAAVNILLLEDESAHAEAIRRAFAASDLNTEVRIVGTLREYREAVAARSPGIVLMDMVLPDGRALDALSFSPENGSFPILVMTSFGNEQTAVEAMKAGALDYIVKSPETFAAMPHVVKQALREWKVLQERKRAEAALRESEERFRVLYDNSTLGLYMTTPDGRIILSNPALVKMLGYSSFDDLSGRDLGTEGFEPSYPRAQFVEMVEKEDGVAGLESAWKRRDGTTVFVRESARAIRGPEGQIVYFDGTVEDVTERKRAEEELSKAEKNFRRSLDESPLGVRIVTAQGKTLYANKAILDLYGYESLEEMNATPLKDRYSPGSYKEHRDRKERRLQGAFPSGYEISIVRKNGEIRVLQVFRKEVIWNGDKNYQALYLDITARKEAERQAQESLQRLNTAMASTIRVLGLTVEARDPYTAGHQRRTTILAEAIAREMGMPPEKIEGLHMAGLVHDIGKISIPAEILSKPSILTTGEMALVKTHAKKGYEILEDVEFPWPLAEIVYQHHERMDGSGYPRGLKGDEILMEARILCVADTMEAMVSHRPYRPALGPQVALAEIEKGKGIRFDTDIAEACLKLFREKRFSFPA